MLTSCGGSSSSGGGGASAPSTPTLTITASSASMTYGGTPPAITPSYSGFTNGDTAASLTTQPTCTTAATKTSVVGTQSSSCTGAVDAKYIIQYVPGTVTVAQAQLTITASGGSIVFGSSAPAITASYSGFVNSDSAASLSAPPTCSTSVTATTPVGSYASTCSGAAAANYAISYTPGTVTVGANAAVNFSLSAPNQESMSGFLYGVFTNSPPPSSMLVPLAPKLWRGTFNPSGNDPYTVMQSLNVGAVYDEIVSDNAWGYPGEGLWNTNNSTSPPYNNAPYDGNFASWEGAVQYQTTTYGTRPAVWEVWNEPDNVNVSTNYFWYGTAAQFYQTYLTGYQVLRAQLGASAIIVGPSPATYDKAFIKGLLDYCVANGCQVNALSWHEANDSDIPAVAADIQDAKTSFLQNPAYASLKIQKIYINESVGPIADYEPGDILAYLYFLETGGADAAAKACWTGPSGIGECADNSVDGLIDPANFAPRAPWWAYKLYSDGVSTRVPVPYTNGSIVALASSGSATPKTAQVLVGYFNNQSPPATTNIEVQLSSLSSVSFLSGLSQAHVHLQKVPNSGSADLTALTDLGTTTVQIVNNALVVPINGIGLHEMYVISVGP